MANTRPVVFLPEADNTLLDNDSVVAVLEGACCPFALADRLQNKGVKAFVASLSELIAGIAAKHSAPAVTQIQAKSRNSLQPLGQHP